MRSSRLKWSSEEKTVETETAEISGARIRRKNGQKETGEELWD